ncbi:FAD-dependent oxidoreductase [Roseibium aggregatum]|uniref:FAD-dependent oxidoreductase n=1 Tax=Roseibium aggregatum TaxID=187304 RepID=A0A926P4M9_9HYPH|nr:FAD-dependent oxidoreductase [Roseibium aggregatum]MBD1549403.1 FAD-dependent oxidoreductase [Roseibium aggregatum]
MGVDRANLAVLSEDDEFDVAVLGAGAAGMAAAVFAALEGCRVLLVERTEYLGGTSAFSAATTWVPNTRHSKTLGAEDSQENALAFLDRAVGNHAPRTLRQAFLAKGPEAIHRLEDATDVQFRGRPFHPDYLYELEGSTAFGRALEPLPFDASMLGEDLKLVRPPIPEFTILGGLMIDRDDIPHLLKMTKSLRSFAYSVRLIGSYYLQKMRFGRSTRLVMGNALIGRMLLAARKLGVTIVTGTETTGITHRGGASFDLFLKQGSTGRRILARRGVVLASGGFARHPKRRAEMLPHPLPEVSPAAPGHTGALHDLVMEMGAHYSDTSAQPCYWAPVSIRKRADGSQAAFPHFVLDRSKPGIISVGRDGKRFVNESRSYHEFVSAMYASNQDGATIPTFLICDADALHKYGMGMIRPGIGNLKPFLDDGYLTRGETLADLAAALGVDPVGLEETVGRMNSFAETGIDEDFSRGTTVYEQANGDPGHGPNPTLGRLSKAPFYALRLWPGDIGSATGLVTDDHARLLRRDGSVIEGLYACGADMNSIMGGVYPGPGITIGPGIVFGYIAAATACGSEAA